ncbi:MAG: hypothetical protein GYB20_12890 [Oceanospirillales bacterium]|nr:hypothetical protein [Oceanospirillales bacterium]MBR9888572.1 hypothetical protein [Oceanospirillales bacterium]
MFEFTEVEKIEDSEFVRSIVEYYQKSGLITAIDDFGSGYAGLGLLVLMGSKPFSINRSFWASPLYLSNSSVKGL